MTGRYVWLPDEPTEEMLDAFRVMGNVRERYLRLRDAAPTNQFRYDKLTRTLIPTIAPSPPEAPSDRTVDTTKLNAGQLVQRIMRVIDTSQSGGGAAQLAQEIAAGILDLPENYWRKPAPEAPDPKLPCDVSLPGLTIKAGCPESDLLDALERRRGIGVASSKEPDLVLQADAPPLPMEEWRGGGGGGGSNPRPSESYCAHSLPKLSSAPLWPPPEAPVTEDKIVHEGERSGPSPFAAYVSTTLSETRRGEPSPSSPIGESISPSDPTVIIAGIRKFGLASDGSDLRDLEAIIARLAPPPPSNHIEEVADELLCEVDNVINVWQNAPSSASFGRYMEKALSELCAARDKANLAIPPQPKLPSEEQLARALCKANYGSWTALSDTSCMGTRDALGTKPFWLNLARAVLSLITPGEQSNYESPLGK